MTQDKKPNKNERVFEPLPKSPTMSESILKLASLYGSRFDKFRPQARTEKLRRFEDRQGVFYEMDNSKKKGVKTIAE